MIPPGLGQANLSQRIRSVRRRPSPRNSIIHSSSIRYSSRLSAVTGLGSVAALEVAPANLVDQARQPSFLCTGTQLALGKHVVDLREADDRAIGIPAQQLVVEVGLRRLHQADARILLAVGHRRGKLGDGIVFGAHFRETGDLVDQVDHLAAILLLSQALLGKGCWGWPGRRRGTCLRIRWLPR